MRRLVASLAVAASLSVACVGANAAPYLLRVGHGFAVEEQVWLMKAMPSITPNQGKVYDLKMFPFRGTDTRFQAFQAGQLDIATSAASAAIFAASQGLDFRIIASISREELPGFVTQYMALESAPIHSLKDLKGKTIGNNAARSSIELWARVALAKAGLDPDRDVKWAIVPFPAQGDAVRSHRIDVGAFPEPFASLEMAKGGMKTVFTSKTGIPFGEELMVLIASPSFLKSHSAVVRAYLSDFVKTTHFYLQHTRKARQALIDSKLVRIPASIYLSMPDNYREPDARIDISALEKAQDIAIKFGFQKQRVDINKLVDMSYLSKK